MQSGCRFRFSEEYKSRTISVYKDRKNIMLDNKESFYEVKNRQYHYALVTPSFAHSNVLRQVAEVSFKIVNQISYSQIAIGMRRFDTLN